MDTFVTLERHALGGFGFSVIGGVDTPLPPMVCAVVQNGAAHLSGKVRAGDVILEVNGKPITQLTTSEVVQCIKDSTDELFLRLREDTGARQRAKPYLRTFTVADPKVQLYQAKLHRTASAPLGPQRISCSDYQKQRHGKNRSQLNASQSMRRTIGSKSEDTCLSSGQSGKGYIHGTDGQYSPTETDESYRLMTYFPIDGRPPKTVEKLPVVKRDRNSFPENKIGSSSSSISSHLSAQSFPHSCPYCGGTSLLASSPGLHREGGTPQSPTRIKCRKCGKNLQLSSSGTSLPERPYTSHHQGHAPSRLKPSTSLPPHASSSHGHERILLQSGSLDDHRTGNGSIVPPRVEDYDGPLSSDSLIGKPRWVEHESPRTLAFRLFSLDGFTKDQVAPQLYKNTTFGKTVAVEYLKLFNFSGLSIVEALRVFTKAFLLIGETQERERILIPFSNRYYQCNTPDYGSADAVHTLVCAVLLLNTDHHGENIGKKMTLSQFLENMAGLCDGHDFPKDLLKSIYQEIRTNPLEWSGIKPSDTPPTPKTPRSANGIRASPGNPYLEIQVDEKDKLFKEGLLYRKVTMESEGKKTSAWKRKWIPFHATLKGMVLFLHKPDEINSVEDRRHCLGVHHSLASRATDYKKRPFVFKFVTADWREFLFQARGRTDMSEWIAAINQVAATFSAPPLPPPIGSCKRFQRPLLPFSKTKLPLPKQLESHESKASQCQEELIDCLKEEPRDGTTREMQEWQEKRDYLDYEYKRYMAYVNVLRGSKLESKKRDKPKGDPRSDPRTHSSDW
ncbi:PH and SEC7 domain-containing protein 1 isoform X4 [Nematostella vectensis]|uniref:PH and SEC7 domain-containing protein 1 isoform X4 n=1 Tax=Nematostella vectensis TaxID=45351 RepID=UPI002077328B|nr:PH and SEC7 domain-containing protein 1 isoform X4 [Nematostella vectensis]